jgi:hypothetical protein
MHESSLLEPLTKAGTIASELVWPPVGAESVLFLMREATYAEPIASENNCALDLSAG